MQRHPHRSLEAGICFLVPLAILLMGNPLRGAPAEDRFAERLFKNGISLIRAGNQEHALQTFDELSRGFPNSPLADDALYRSGSLFYPASGLRSLHRAGRDSIARAIPYFQRIQEEYTYSDTAPLALYKMALLALESRNPGRSLDEAFARFSRLLALYPDSPVTDRALLGTAHVQSRMGECGQAMNHLDRLLERFPESAASTGALALSASCQADLEQWVPAMESLQELIDAQGNSLEGSQARRFLTLIYRTRFLPSLGRQVPLVRDTAFETETSKAGMRSCRGLAVGGNGRVYAGDPRQSFLWSFQEGGQPIGKSARPGGIRWVGLRGGEGILTGNRGAVHRKTGVHALDRKGTPLLGIESVAISEDGTIFVLDSREEKIFLFDENLAYQDELLPPGEGRPVKIRNGPRRHLFLLTEAPSGLFRREADGGWREIHLEVEMTETRPIDFAVDGVGNLYLLSRRGGPVLVFHPGGKLLVRLEMPSDPDRPRLIPGSLAVGPEGTIYLCGRKSDRIVRFR